ncbi:tyrosine--tRNA ligase [Hyphomonas pacifica]|uniref:Tyrosine--tRNA ligase n=1 Tax=Hyphomonas pacifica TaxID=1280941 RepID=A0A062U6S6_9PROT|nr:tyrosine--tRNA ligase [Hyphomonas pacifica]KCZ51845.1 tyrosyl-tRNA synthetase [Hyphomonas pacifica]RAN34591.1 tyrosyl-tRNA synthetase [Hyphomonas pacifica]RAN36903.1 tyrosyl-tRNA synthetase [Hyphomonas pacifica]
MSEYKSEFLKTLSERGYIKQVTHPKELDAYCREGTPIGYIGFDATADSLHVGSLLQIMMLRQLQKAGGKPIVLMGGGTTKVGDPTDKEKSRPLLTNEQIEANIAGIKKAFEPFLKFGDGPTDAIMVNNDDWLSKLGYIDMLREVGVHFTINTMVKQDTVARRLAAEQPYTFLEFNYLLMQSYDFLELFRRQNCRLQFGGSDQWGNIVGGVDLVHKADGGEVYGLTAHLITTASGAKMGKTADGAVWLNADRKSPYEYWQFWRNTEDADVGRFLRLFTELPLEEIARLETLEGAEINQAKITLANEATTLLHGEAAAKEAEAAAAAVFAQGGSAEALPTVEVARAEIEGGMLVAAAFMAAGLTDSNGEARRLIKQGAAKVNDVQVKDQNAALSADNIIDGTIKLSAGKKRHALVKAV